MGFAWSTARNPLFKRSTRRRLTNVKTNAAMARVAVGTPTYTQTRQIAVVQHDLKLANNCE
jgi:hypothetical protein